MTKYKDYYSLKELQDEFGKSKHTIRKWISKGWLKAETGKLPFPWEYYVKKEEWLKMPEFMRKPRKCI